MTVHNDAIHIVLFDPSHFLPGLSKLYAKPKVMYSQNYLSFRLRMTSYIEHLNTIIYATNVLQWFVYIYPEGNLKNN